MPAVARRISEDVGDEEEDEEWSERRNAGHGGMKGERKRKVKEERA